MVIPFTTQFELYEAFDDVLQPIPLLAMLEEMIMIYEADPQDRMVAQEELLLLLNSTREITSYPHTSIDILSMQAQAGLDEIGLISRTLDSVSEIYRRLLSRMILLKCLSQYDICVAGDTGILMGISNYFILGLLASAQHLPLSKERSLYNFLAGVYHSRIMHPQISIFAGLACVMLKNHSFHESNEEIDLHLLLKWLEEYNSLNISLTHPDGGILDCTIHNRYKMQWSILFEDWGTQYSSTSEEDVFKTVRSILFGPGWNPVSVAGH